MSNVEHLATAADRAIGARVRHMRKARGWSLRKMAERAEALGLPGLEFGKIGRLERGVYGWSTEYAARFALILGVDTDTILSGRGGSTLTHVEREVA